MENPSHRLRRRCFIWLECFSWFSESTHDLSGAISCVLWRTLAWNSASLQDTRNNLTSLVGSFTECLERLAFPLPTWVPFLGGGNCCVITSTGNGGSVFKAADWKVVSSDPSAVTSYVCMHTFFTFHHFILFCDSEHTVYRKVIDGQMCVFIYSKHTNGIELLTCAQSRIAVLLCSVKMDVARILAELIVFLFFFAGDPSCTYLCCLLLENSVNIIFFQLWALGPTV